MSTGFIKLNKDKKRVVSNRSHHVTTATAPISTRFTENELAICARVLSELVIYSAEKGSRSKKPSRNEVIRVGVKLLNKFSIEEIYNML